MSTKNNYRPRKKKKMMKESEFNDGDLISKLPDPLLHHIFSFLDMKLVIQTSILSRRWRDLWISQPIMNFDEEVYSPSKYSNDHYQRSPDSSTQPIMNFDEEVYSPSKYSNDHYQRSPDSSRISTYYKFIAFVGRALFLHSTSKIHTFRLKCKDECQGNAVDLNDWMPILDRRKVEVIDLQIEMTEEDSIFELPESFFKCRSLTTLKLDFGPKNDLGFFKIVENEEYDTKSSLTKLKTLHLRSILLGGGITEYLISKCRNLETLVISNCSFDMDPELHISHYQLKHLVLEKLKECNSIVVCALRLTSFSCRDYYPINDYSFESTYSLVEADIDTDYHSTDSEWDKISQSRNMNKCLRELHKVRSLTLSAWLLQLAFQNPNDGFNFPINQFCNLRYLTLKTSLSISQIRATINLLEKCPQLETLVLKITQVKISSDQEKEIWEAKLEPKCMMDQLKFVEIWGVQATANELEFLKFLLKNAIVLETLVVNTPQDQPNNAGELRRFREMLRSFGGTSSSVRISFL